MFKSYVLCLLVSAKVFQKVLCIYVNNAYWFIYLFTWKKHQLLWSFITHICCLNQYIKLQVIWKHIPVFPFLFLATPLELNKEHISNRDNISIDSLIFMSCYGMSLYMLSEKATARYIHIVSWGFFITSLPLYQYWDKLISFEPCLSLSRHHRCAFCSRVFWYWSKQLVRSAQWDLPTLH